MNLSKNRFSSYPFQSRKMDFCPIAIFNKYISKPCGRYYVEDNGILTQYNIMIIISKTLPFDLQAGKISALLETLSIFRESFLNSSTKFFDQTKVDYITRKMDPIKKELFKLALIRYYQILSIEFSKFFTNIVDLLTFANTHQFNEKILCGIKYFSPTCDVSVFSAEDFSFENECIHHSNNHKIIIQNILYNVDRNNGLEFPP